MKILKENTIDSNINSNNNSKSLIVTIGVLGIVIEI